MDHKKPRSWRGVPKIALRQDAGRTDRNGLRRAAGARQHTGLPNPGEIIPDGRQQGVPLRHQTEWDVGAKLTRRLEINRH